MSAITTLNPKAESARQAQALAINISAARGLAEMLKTNLGPKGTMKMLVSGAGDIKITKDGCTLLHEMQVQHLTAQDDITGDGATSIVLLIGELLKQADLYISEIVVDAVLALNEPGKPTDLNMVEIMEMQHRTEGDSRLVRGIVLDHVNAGFFYKNAEGRDRLVTSERKSIDDHVQKIVELKRKVCLGDDKNKIFVLVNQKGIDPLSLDILAKDGILALRRAKRRNMERITLSCGGEAMNSVENLTKDCHGFAQDALGEEKFTFIERCKNPKSVTVLLKGSTKYILNQLKEMHFVMVFVQ
ncbi:unnamed protein product [Adineta steineri]|uniref:Uncharacterized protein n=1 Tax=Adineta steineri TaxID=433720 RepID=A0A815AAW0_9BILA|nr:unnamed protein product [Adineta steineri]CAF1585717.1 unnamed protein product [Adineta steineri]